MQQFIAQQKRTLPSNRPPFTSNDSKKKNNNNTTSNNGPKGKKYAAPCIILLFDGTELNWKELKLLIVDLWGVDWRKPEIETIQITKTILDVDAEGNKRRQPPTTEKCCFQKFCRNGMRDDGRGRSSLLLLTAALK